MNLNQPTNVLPLFVGVVALTAVLALLPDVAFASYGRAPWEKALQTLVDLLTGTTARLVAIIAVAAVGYMTFAKGMIPWGFGISVIIAIAIIFGAASIVDLFAS